MTIPRRDVDFALDPATVPRDWCSGDPFETTFLNALSMLFPEGERFFVDSVKAHKHLVSDPKLRRDIDGFIGQEAMHGKEHRAFNDLLVAHGYTEAGRVDARLRRFFRFVRNTLSPKSQVAVTCALEHFTALLAEQLLGEPRIRDRLHPAVRPLWLWHALEESEHKAVAFDVYRAAGGGYIRRVSMMLLTSVVFFAVQWLVHGRLLATRGVLWRPWTWLRGLTRMWLWPGFFARLAPAYLSYYRPRFHPSDRDNRALLESWRAQLFGDTGALRDRLRAVA